MKIVSVTDESFAPYGKIIEGHDFSGLLNKLEEVSEKPADHVEYVPSVPALEALPVFEKVRDQVYGGMPIQFGYCNGTNTRLNCLEYHRDSEINVMADDAVLLVAREDDIKGGKLDTSCVRAFLVPKGTAVEVYATTLHYAPCSAKKGEGFRVIIVLPRGTNTDKPAITPANPEDRMLFARNKWLLAHPDASESKKGAYVGLTGVNIDIAADI